MSLPPILTTTEEINEFATHLEKFPVIAVDLEADSMHHYHEQVCLLQFTTPEKTVLIDPLNGADLAALRPVFADANVRKLFHAADYDIRCLARDFDIEINGLFDTMISSQFVGEERFGLADMLGKYFNLELDKKYQRADWTVRPLTEGMICYAAGDTQYLQELAAILEGQLQEKGRLSWVQEEFEILEQVRFAEHEGPAFLRFKGAGTLQPRQLAVLEALLQWRDAEALRRDCPLYKVVGNKQLLELARAMPKGRKDIENVAGMPPRLAQRYGSKLLAAVAEGLDVAAEQLPHYPRKPRQQKDPEAEKRFGHLKDWRKKVSGQLELDPGVLINNATLEEIAKRQPRNADELEAMSLLKKWQAREFGDAILKVVN